MAKIEAGKMSLEAIPFNLDEVINRVADTLEMAAHEKGLELVVHRSREIPAMLIGDPLRLGQVLLNLASNAVKFTSSGEISLSVERERYDEAAGAIVLRFSVTDTGIGISNEQLAQLFQPFTQADMAVTRIHGGTGLGLTIVKQLVQLMGGSVEVASAPDIGSDFSFAARFAVAPAETHVAATAANYAGLRVLIVDDNDSARMALQHILDTAGCQVTAVSGGAEAIGALRAAGREAPYQLVLMDWNMPGMDGIETTAASKRDPPSAAGGGDGHRLQSRRSGDAGQQSGNRHRCLPAQAGEARAAVQRHRRHLRHGAGRGTGDRRAGGHRAGTGATGRLPHPRRRRQCLQPARGARTARKRRARHRHRRERPRRRRRRAGRRHAV
jgi:CheY-like chemotaxis protein